MAYPVDSVATTLIFSLDTGSVVSDEADITFWWGSDVLPTTNAQWDLFLLALAQNVCDHWTATVGTNTYHTSVKLKHVKARRVGTDGKTLQEQVYVDNPATQWKGGGTSGAGASLPWQLSQVIGLYSYTPGSFIAEPRTRRGRVFMPPYSTNALTDYDNGEMSLGFALDRITEVARTLNLVTSGTYDAVGLGAMHPFPVVVSRTRSLAFKVTDLAGSNKFGTQRRRRNQLQDVRQQLGLVGA